jgi:squamous cell carcinoma antigen recognized by T-cells 3
MDESESLEAISGILNELAEKPYDFSLHVKHIQESEKASESQSCLAREMFTSYFAAGEGVWLPLIEAKLKSEDLESSTGVENVLSVFELAEEDYLCEFH